MRARQWNKSSLVLPYTHWICHNLKNNNQLLLLTSCINTIRISAQLLLVNWKGCSLRIRMLTKGATLCLLFSVVAYRQCGCVVKVLLAIVYFSLRWLHSHRASGISTSSAFYWNAWIKGRKLIPIDRQLPNFLCCLFWITKNHHQPVRLLSSCGNKELQQAEYWFMEDTYRCRNVWRFFFQFFETTYWKKFRPCPW